MGAPCGHGPDASAFTAACTSPCSSRSTKQAVYDALMGTDFSVDAILSSEADKRQRHLSFSVDRLLAARSVTADPGTKTSELQRSCKQSRSSQEARDKTESDLAMGPFFPAEERLEIANPTSMFYVEELRILAGRPKAEDSNVFGYILAFDWMVWMFLMITLCTITVLTAVIKVHARPSRFRLRNLLRAMDDAFWQYLENLFFEASAEVPETESLRVISATWWIAVMVLMNAFCGHLRACLMIKSEVEKINTVRQLIQKPRIVPYMWKGTSYVAMVAHSSNEHLQQIGRVVRESNTAQPSSVLYGEALLSRIVAGRAVVITDGTSLVFRVSSTCRNFRDGEFYLAEESLVAHPLNSFVRKDMDPKLLSDINRVIRRLVEAGLVNYWWSTAAGDMSTCSTGSQMESADTLAFSDLLAVYTLLPVGVLFAVVALVAECFCCRRKKL